jgi:hypothetical protein
VKPLVGVLALSLVCLSFATGSTQSVVQDVAFKMPAFDPKRGDKAVLTYTLSAPERLTVKVWDPDRGLVRTLLDRAERPSGRHQETWDGRDSGGIVVPDEAYTATIETDSGSVFDPITFSGGLVGDVKEARFDGAGTVTYQLPAAARVLIRLGVQSGPLLKTLVDWKPRMAGAATEYWDGRDNDKLIRLRDLPSFTALITYVTLPDATVIAFGNDQETYRDYKLGRGKNRPLKPVRARLPDREGRLRPEGLVPPAWAQAPKVALTFPRLGAEAVPQVSGHVDVRVDVDQGDRTLLLRDQFEIIFFVNNVFFTEAERGHLPFNWRWELKQLPPGEHVLTVNIASFKGQVGVASRKVRVVKQKE